VGAAGVLPGHDRSPDGSLSDIVEVMPISG